MKTSKQDLLKRRHLRVRRKVTGTPERPRLSVFRSLKHIQCQVIDDMKGRTLVAVSTQSPELKPSLKKGGGGNLAAAELVGKAIAERALKAGIKQVVFDRGGYRYHGRVMVLADAARKGGLSF